jgi:4-amino-4-deoxy-L-arabinose transferase-like glycosyltransferase
MTAGLLPSPFLRTPVEALVWLLGLLWLASNWVLAWFTPLTPDEAHYALYGLNLDWSYFDHPPMVGWMQALALNLGESEFILRLWPIVLSILSLVWVAHWTGSTFGRTAMWTVLGLWWLAPIPKLLGFALVPEVPLLLFSWAVFVQTYKLTLAESQSLSDWFWLGVLLGLAALSKYTAITLALSVSIALVQYRGWSVLRTPGLWLTAVVASLLISPILYWNYQHDWISFAYQLDHSAGRSQWNLMDAVRMQLTQLASFSPAVYLLGLAALIATLRRGTAEQRLLALFALPILLLFSVLAAKGRSLPHWTAVGVLFTLPLIGSWISEWRQIWQRCTVVVLLLISMTLSVVLLLVLFRAPLPYPDYQHPLADAVGWKSLAKTMKQMAIEASNTQSTPVSAQSEPAQSLSLSGSKVAAVPLFISNWSHASRIAWYAKPLTLYVLDQRYDQFDLWFGAPKLGTKGIVLTYLDYSGWHREGLEAFSRCHFKERMSWADDQVKIHEFEVYLCEDYRPKS